MRIAIANISNRVSREEFRVTVHAIARQVREDFAPLWSMDADIRHATLGRSAKPNPELNLADVILYVGETDDDPQKVKDAVGYHDMNHRGVPFGFVFTDVAEKVGEAWSTTLSHEVLELIADPDVNLLVVAPHPHKARASVLRPYEVCDPVQADTYTIDGVAVSNFVTPLYFAELPHPVQTRTNYMSLPLDRYAVRPEGYFSYLDLSTGRWENVFGENAEKRVGPKEILGNARRMRRHQALNLPAGRHEHR